MPFPANFHVSRVSSFKAISISFDLPRIIPASDWVDVGSTQLMFHVKIDDGNPIEEIPEEPLDFHFGKMKRAVVMDDEEHNATKSKAHGKCECNRYKTIAWPFSQEKCNITCYIRLVQQLLLIPVTIAAAAAAAAALSLKHNDSLLTH
eukprot:535116-Pelagomonas_calceolata.AAC.5